VPTHEYEISHSDNSGSDIGRRNNERWKGLAFCHIQDKSSTDLMSRNLPSTNDIYRFKQLLSSSHNTFSYLICTRETPMPKPKKSTSKRRQTPYPTLATPANPNPRSAPTRSFAPLLGFPSTFSNPVYPQYSLTPFELGQTLHDYCRDLQNGIQRSPNVDEVLEGTTRVHLIFLKLGKGLVQEEKEDLKKLLEMLVLISIRMPRGRQI
jgi:hypothetical protein